MYNSPMTTAAQNKVSDYAGGKIAPPTTSALSSLTADLRGNNGRLSAQLQRARSIADDYFGSQPPTPETNARNVEESVEGRADELSRVVRENGELLDALTQQMDRLSCV